MPSVNVGNQGQANQSGGSPPPPTAPGAQRGPSGPSSGDGTPNFASSGSGRSSASDDDEPPLPTRRTTRPVLGSPPPLPERNSRPAGQRPAGPRPLRPALVSGDRDWIIFIECRQNSLIIYPSRQEIPVSALNNDPNNALLRSVQRMIDHKQASVLPGDLPYRPHIRFLVRPEDDETMHRAYPALQALPVLVPMSRRTVEPEESVQEILNAG